MLTDAKAPAYVGDSTRTLSPGLTSISKLWQTSRVLPSINYNRKTSSTLHKHAAVHVLKPHLWLHPCLFLIQATVSYCILHSSSLLICFVVAHLATATASRNCLHTFLYLYFVFTVLAV